MIRPNYVYHRNCTSFSHTEAHRPGNLIEMIDKNIEITRKTFLRHVDSWDISAIAGSLGYQTHPSKGLTMKNDFHITYHRSKLYGETVYYFRHSAIEYIFVQEK